MEVSELDAMHREDSMQKAVTIKLANLQPKNNEQEKDETKTVINGT